MIPFPLISCVFSLITDDDCKIMKFAGFLMHKEHHNIILDLLITLPPPPSFGKLEPPKAFVTCVAHSFQTSIIDPTTKRERPLPDGHKVLQQLSIPGDELSCIPEPSTQKKKTCSTALREKGRRYT